MHFMIVLASNTKLRNMKILIHKHE